LQPNQVRCSWDNGVPSNGDERSWPGSICFNCKFQLCPYFARTPMVLKMGMRPTSTWFPFMSIDSCSRRMVDAILKEKCVSFMPNYVTLVPMIKGLLSLNTARSLREYLGINYDTDCDVELINRRKSDPSEEYFSVPSIMWWLVISGVLVLVFAVGSVLESRLGCNCWIVYSVYLVLLFVHIIEAIYTLHFCDEMRFRFEFSLLHDKHHISASKMSTR
ncbi:hypothetical protein ANCCAN_14913, partial [Ancylostoma caninum]